jgi:raffinose/stachyose/melibiose transport system permease protein
MYSERSVFDRLKTFATFSFIPLFAFATVLLIPFLLGLLLTFTDWNGVSAISSLDYHWIGLENYTAVFHDKDFWAALVLTFKYVILVVIFTNVVAFSIALLVTSKLKARNFFRSVFFVPNLIGGVILGFIWVFIFSRFMEYLGSITNIPLFQFSWLVDPDKAFIALVIVSVWQLSGYMMLIYIAGLVGVPNDVIEAASIDGATQLQQLRHVVMPLMIPAFTISLFLTLRNSFMVFDVNLALTGGGPFRSTELVTLHIYNEAFLYQHYGDGQAKSVILFVIVATIAVIQVLATNRLVHR